MRLVGVLMWPAVALHAVFAVWCVASLRSRVIDTGFDWMLAPLVWLVLLAGGMQVSREADAPCDAPPVEKE